MANDNVDNEMNLLTITIPNDAAMKLWSSGELDPAAIGHFVVMTITSQF